MRALRANTENTPAIDAMLAMWPCPRLTISSRASLQPGSVNRDGAYRSW